MLRKKLFIHAGGGKAGSSMLQNFLAAKRSNLLDYGYSYWTQEKIASHHAVSSGNGLHLFRLLNEGNCHDGARSLQNGIQSTKNKHFYLKGVHDFIEQSFDGQCNSIVSSEFLGRLNESSWSTIKEVCESIEVDVIILYIVRDPFNYYISEYDQAIKRHNETCSLIKFIEKKQWDHFYELKNIHNSFEINKINLLHYTKNNLLDKFLKLLNIDASSDFIGDWNDVFVNRALSAHERDIMLMLNEYGDVSLSSQVSEIFLSFDDGDKFSIQVPSDLFFEVNMQHKSEVDWINYEFFSGKEVVRPVPNINLQMGEASGKFDAIQKPYKVALRLLINELSESSAKSVSDILDKLQYYLLLPPVKSNMPEIPSDFNIVAYLLLNRDVLFSKMDPYDHYINFGQYEHRAYKFIL